MAYMSWEGVLPPTHFFYASFTTEIGGLGNIQQIQRHNNAYESLRLLERGILSSYDYHLELLLEDDFLGFGLQDGVHVGDHYHRQWVQLELAGLQAGQVARQLAGHLVRHLSRLVARQLSRLGQLDAGLLAGQLVRHLSRLVARHLACLGQLAAGLLRQLAVGQLGGLIGQLAAGLLGSLVGC